MGTAKLLTLIELVPKQFVQPILNVQGCIYTLTKDDEYEIIAHLEYLEIIQLKKVLTPSRNVNSPLSTFLII